MAAEGAPEPPPLLLLLPSGELDNEGAADAEAEDAPVRGGLLTLLAVPTMLPVEALVMLARLTLPWASMAAAAALGSATR